MTEKLEALLKCDTLEQYQPLIPSRTYTYLLNDTGEEFKRKPLLLNVFTDNEEIADGNSHKKQEEYTSILEAQPEAAEKPKKKGFFAGLFGRKKQD